VGTWQLKIDGLGESAITPYLPALALLLISQAFYFYRIPRTHRRFTVTWEFVATTFLFILTHLCLWRIVISGPLNLVITLLMLCGLFWLQWVGLVATADVD
jgi:hypothetical protein